MRELFPKGEFTGFSADLATPEGAAALFARVPDANILVNNVGTGRPNAPSPAIDKAAADRLSEELRAFIAALIEPDALSLYRMIVADGWRSPDLARVFDQSGMRVIRQRISAILEAGGVPTDQSMSVAADVVALSLGDAYQRAVLGIVEEGADQAFAQQIEAAVRYGFNQAVS